MKRTILIVCISMIIVVGATFPSIAVSQSNWCAALETIATNLQTHNWTYKGSFKGGWYTRLGTDKSGKEANCQDYVQWSLQKVGVLSKNQCKKGYLPKYNAISPELAKQVIVIKCKVGTTKIHDRVYSGEAYGSVGEYPTLKQLVNWGIAQRGDIISQYDNPNKYRNGLPQVKEIKKNGKKVDIGNGTQYHTEVNMSTKKQFRIYGVGARYQVVNGRFKAANILNTQYDTRNQHNNPHVAMLIRLK